MGELIWDERLITRAEALDMPADWPVRPGIRRGLLFLDCGKCGQAVMQLGTTRSPFRTSPLAMSQAVLRHMVSGHGMPLNHRRTNGDHSGAAGGGPGVDPAPGSGRDVRGAARRGAAGRRPAAQTAGRDREPGPAGGDRE